MKRRLVRLTTTDISLNKLIEGQLKFLSTDFDVIGVASDTGVLKSVGEREGVRVVDVPMHREISLKDDVRSLIALYKLFKTEKPDILHCNTPKGSLLGLMAGKLAGVPRRVYTVTGLRYQGAQGLFRWVLMTMERISCYCATTVVPEGQGVLHTLQKDHITRKPLQVLHHGNINGIDTSFFSREALTKSDHSMVSRESLGFSDEDFVFVFIGRIVHDKGMNELASVMKKLEGETLDCPVKLLLVGTFESRLDPLEGDNEAYLMSSSSVKYVGFQDDVRTYLAVADALVFPSYREGFPNVPIQAGALDLPSIVTDINGCNEIIKDGLNGKIIAAPLSVGPEKMEKALYETMKWFVEHQEEVSRMARNARGMITSRYEQKDVWAATLRMYQSL